jgi:hypothetical protein
MPKRRGRGGLCMRIRLDRTLGRALRASVSHPVPRLGSGLELRRRAFMPARRRAGRLVDRYAGDVPPGGLPRPLGGVGRPALCSHASHAGASDLLLVHANVGGAGPEASCGRRGVAPEVSTQPLFYPPGGAGVGYPPASRGEVDAVPPHIIHSA